MAASEGDRIAKVIARAGLCSRREAERWIEAGRVAVDGVTLTSPALTVTDKNVVVIDGKPLPRAEQARLWRYHKPRGLVTTHRDPEGRETVFAKIAEQHPSLPRLISIGRLDLNSEGLLLLTNSGELARALESPKTGWVRQYRVRVNGRVDEKRLQSLKKGVTVSGVRYGPIEAELESRKGANSWITVGITEGKNREIRKVMESLGHQVSRLIRVSYGPLHLGKLDRGDVRAVPAKTLVDYVGDLAPGIALPGANSKDSSAQRKGWAKAKAKPKKRPPRNPAKTKAKATPKAKPRRTLRLGRKPS